MSARRGRRGEVGEVAPDMRLERSECRGEDASTDQQNVPLETCDRRGRHATRERRAEHGRDDRDASGRGGENDGCVEIVGLMTDVGLEPGATADDSQRRPASGVGRCCDPGAVFELAQSVSARCGVSVVGDEEWFGEQDRLVEFGRSRLWVVGPVDGQRRVEVAVKHSSSGDFGCGLDRVDGASGPLRRVAGDGGGERWCDRRDETDGQVEPGMGCGQVVSDGVERVLDRCGVAHHGAASGRDARSAHRTLEQFGPGRVFQSAEVLRDRRWGQVQRPCCGGDAAATVDFQQ